MTTPVDPVTCQHEEFSALVKVARISDTGRFTAELSVHCVQCDTPFRAIGIPAGLLRDRPSCSIDSQEVYIPIEPAVTPQLQASARYEMPPPPGPVQ